MASISELLQKIMSARFGKDVRSSIHDAISAMNEESEAAKSAAITAQNSAQASATSAATSATNAQASATNAQASATNAATSVTEADGFAKLAESYAKGGTGTREGEDTNNAKYYADKGNEIYNNFIENELDIQMVGYPTPPQLKMKNYRDAEGIYHQTTSRVDLGELLYTYTMGEKPYFTARVPNATQIIDGSVLGNIYCEEYTEVDYQKIYRYKAGDLAIGVSGSGYIYIRDYRYTDIDSFRDAHRGVYAYFSIYPDIEITNSDVIERLNEKVDKIEGKGLSTNDYTTDEKNKLAGIASGATANAGTITEIKMNGASKGTSGSVDLGTVLTSHQDISGKQDKLTAGDNITITDNVISASGGKGEGFVQQTDSSWKFEKNANITLSAKNYGSATMAIKSESTTEITSEDDICVQSNAGEIQLIGSTGASLSVNEDVELNGNFIDIRTNKRLDASFTPDGTEFLNLGKLEFQTDSTYSFSNKIGLCYGDVRGSGYLRMQGTSNTGICLGVDPETGNTYAIKMYADCDADSDYLNECAKFRLDGDEPSLLCCGDGLDIVSNYDSDYSDVMLSAGYSEIAITNDFDSTYTNAYGTYNTRGINRIKLNRNNSTDKGALVLGHYWDLGSGVPDADAITQIKLDTNKMSLNVDGTDGDSGYMYISPGGISLGEMMGVDWDGGLSIVQGVVTLAGIDSSGRRTIIKMSQGKVEVTAPNGFYVNGTKIG